MKGQGNSEDHIPASRQHQVNFADHVRVDRQGYGNSENHVPADRPGQGNSENHVPADRPGALYIMVVHLTRFTSPPSSIRAVGLTGVG